MQESLPTPPTATTTGSPVTDDDAAKHDGTTPESLAADIERTREDLAHTLDAIAEKVSPKRVASRTTKKVTQAAADAAGSVRDGVHAAKDKIGGGPEEPVAPVLATTSASAVPHSSPAFPPKYLVGGGVAALVVVLLLRRRRAGR